MRSNDSGVLSLYKAVLDDAGAVDHPGQGSEASLELVEQPTELRFVAHVRGVVMDDGPGLGHPGQVVPDLPGLHEPAELRLDRPRRGRTPLTLHPRDEGRLDRFRGRQRGGLGRLLLRRQLGTADDQQGRPEAAGQLQGDRRGDAPGPSRDQDRLARLEGGWRLLVRGKGGGPGFPGEASATEVSHLHRSLTTAQFPEQRLGQLGGGIAGVQVDPSDEHLGPFMGQALDEPEHAAVPRHGGGRVIGLEPEPAPQAGRREQEGLAVPAGLPQVIAQGTGEQVERLDVTPGPAVPRLALDRLGQRRQVDQAADGPVLLPDTTEHVGHRLRVGQVGVESAGSGPEAGSSGGPRNTVRWPRSAS